jgi:hypothetical protein
MPGGNGFRARVPLLAVLCCVARLARADVDPSGAWTVGLTEPDPTFGAVAVKVNFQRSGTSLSAYVQDLSISFFGLFPYQLTGSIDPMSGAFSISGHSRCSALNLDGTDSISGTFDPSGDTLAGTMTISFLIGSPIKCLGVSGTATGVRGSPTCGNGFMDSGESCDFSPDAPGCCGLDCSSAAPTTSYCTLNDYGCGKGGAESFLGSCSECKIGRCDGAGGCVQTPLPASRVCRRARNACDLDESCDGTSLTCPPDQVVPPPDTDGDGLNDGCDPCTDGGQVSKPRLALKRLSPPEPNDRMSLKATLSLADPAMLDPVQHGLRLLVVDAQGLLYTDLTVPPNPQPFGDQGWQVTSSGWRFRGKGRITSVKIKRTASSPGELMLTMRGKDVVFGVPPQANLPVKATVVLDPPFATTGLCAEVVFPGPPGVNPSCTDQRDGSTVNCR